MNISLRWLSQYLNVDDFFAEPVLLEEKLTHAGLEVEGIENHAKKFAHVKVGHIVEYGKHPDADRLTVCQLDVGEESTRQIVCGATNHKQGDRVVVAVPGAVLPGDFAIKKSKIRGVESLGMLCSEVELGLADESPGIMILPEDAPVGEEFANYQGLDDVIFELSVTPNRADCLSHFGLAREIACLLDRPIEFPIKSLQVTSESTQKYISLDVEDNKLCPRYAGRMLRGVTVKESPAWLKRFLESVGLNSINNIVDVTNYVMMELGQPMHAFDADELAGSSIKVALAEKGEKFITLDGSEVELSGEELMIRDSEKPVALAGVVGGINSGVSEDTKNIFLESAYFTMAGVRKTARKFGIETDSAYRFSRGVDPEGAVLAMNRAAQLMQEVAGGEILDEPYDIYPNPVVREQILVRLSFVSQKLGYEVSHEDFESWMKRLQCVAEKKDDDTYMVSAPAYRWDLFIEEDFVEEYARLNGYDKIPESLPPLVMDPTPHHPSYTLQNMVHRSLQGQGFQQVLNYSFLDASFQKEFLGDVTKMQSSGLNCSAEPIEIRNPLSEELGVMRSSVLASVIKNVSHNDRHDHHCGRIYEIGPVFLKGSDGEYLQESRLSMSMWGEPEELWGNNSPLVYRLKAEIEKFLYTLKSRSWRWQPMPVEKVPDFIHPGRCAGLFYEGRVIGFVGTLHPKWVEQLKIKSSCVLAEFDFDSLMRGQPRVIKAKSPSRFPRVERDLAFVMPKSLAVGDVMGEIRKAAGQMLYTLSVFDVYEGDNLPSDQRSVAFRLSYRGESETLTDDQILQLQSKVTTAVEKKFSISVR